MRNQETCSTVKYIDLCMRTIGVHVYKDNRKPIELAIYTFLLMFAAFATSVYAIISVSQNRKDEAMNVAAYYGTATLLGISLPNLLYNKLNIRKFLKEVSDNVYTYSDESEITVRYHRILRTQYTKTVFIAVICYICSGYCITAISPMTSFFITKQFDAYVYPGWYPWPTANIVGWLAVNVVQIGTGVIGCWTEVTFLVILVLCAMEFARQYKRLAVAIVTLKGRTEKQIAERIRRRGGSDGGSKVLEKVRYINYRTSTFEMADRDMYNQLFKEKIIECIKHFQQIYRLLDLIRPWFTFLFTLELTMSTVTFAFVFCNLINQMSNPRLIITMVGSSWIVIGNLFSRCYIGQFFSDINEQITEAIFYEAKWHDQTLENKRLLFIFHSLTLRPIEIQAFAVFRASYVVFGGIMRISYSYFNIIRTRINKKH